MTRYLGYKATHWNRISEHAESRRYVESLVNRHLHRVWMASLTGAQFKVYSFIVARTLGWQKYAEAIPVRHFIDGLCEADGTLYRDDEGLPACAGTGIRKEDTIRAALEHLRQSDLITVFPGKRGTVTAANVFLPLGEDRLATLAVRGGAPVLPEHLTRFYVGEHVTWNGEICRITGIEIDAVRLQPVSRSGHLREQKYTAPDREVERVRLDDWKAFKKRE